MEPVHDDDWLAERFEARRPHLRAVAYRMLGSTSEADDALQEAWLRIGKAGADGVENLDGWFTTIVGRVSLNLLRSRKAKRELPLEGRIPDPVVSAEDGTDPEHEALTADSVGVAMLVVLESLSPAERIAFVLHDVFAVGFDEIASITDRSPDAARQLASRARRRVRGGAPSPDPDVERQREVVDAFFAAARDGDFEALTNVLDPDAVLHEDSDESRPDGWTLVRGAEAVASRAMAFREGAPHARPVLVNGAAGVLVAPQGRPVAIMAFTVTDGRVAQIDVLNDPNRLARLDLDRFV